MNFVASIKTASSIAATFLIATTVALSSSLPAFAAVNSPAPAAKISFTFDDGLDSALTQAAPTLAKYGLTGTDYVITNCVGMTTVPNKCLANEDAKYMNWAQITQLQSTYKWDIGSHTATHPQLATGKLTPAKLETEINGSKQTLASHGINATDFASPYGDYNNATLAVIAKYYASHRGFWDLNNNIWSYNDYLINNMQVQEGVTVAQVKARIDEAIASKTWLVLTMHDIKTTPSTNVEDYEYSTAELDQIAAYVKSKKDAGLIAPTNIDKGLVTSDTNLLANSTFDAGLSGGWTTNAPLNVKADKANNGSYPSPTNSIAITAGATNQSLYSPQVLVDSAQTYMLKSFVNVATLTSGELGYYIDEYDAAGNWISGKWIQAKYAPIVQSTNFTYQPSSANVKKASLQVYVTANSGIKAYVDNFQWFSLSGATTPPATNNIMTNSTFDAGITGGWTTDNTTAFKADTANHGSPTDVAKSVKLTGQATAAHLFSPKVSVKSTSAYTVNAFVNVLTRQSGEVGFYIDEYDSRGLWISGQYVYAKRTVGAETISFSYKPTTASVAQASVQTILSANSGITGYLDTLKFMAPQGETPTPPTPAPTNMVSNGTFDAGMASWSTNDAVNIKADAGSNGSVANPVNSISLAATTQDRHLFGPQVSLVAGKSYSISSYLNLKQITAGEVGYYIDEYDAAGNWISGQYKTGIRVVSAGDVNFQYTASSSVVAKASLQVIVAGNSGVKAFVDDVRWYQN